MNKITEYIQFINLVNMNFSEQQKQGIRYGQCLYNTLFDIYPILARKIVGTDMDPFYTRNSKDIKIQKTFEMIEEYILNND